MGGMTCTVLVPHACMQVLGAHEGEGLALEAGSLGVAGSKSPFMANKGQQVS
jgi:hypothetical protein